jgi:hypothetical protein
MHTIDPYIDSPPTIQGKDMPPFSPLMRKAIAGLAKPGANNALYVAAYIAAGLKAKYLITENDAEEAMAQITSEEYDAAEAYISRVFEREQEARVDVIKPEGKQPVA